MVVVTTGEEIPGKKIAKIVGIVQGSTVRAKNIGRDIVAEFKNIIGGEIRNYTDLLTQAREEAYNRMVNGAVDLGSRRNNRNEIHDFFRDGRSSRNCCIWNCS